MKKILFIFVLSVCCAIPGQGQAADPASLESQIKQLNETVGRLALLVESQQREIDQLKGVRATAAEISQPSVSAPAVRTQGAWNPEIGAVADVVAKLDSPRADTEGADRLSVRELELVLGSAVDPYSRLDATISFSDFEEAALEEAYYTNSHLPWEVALRIGRFKPRVGKAISVHRYELDTVDEPLVIQRYFGLEGYSKSGADLTRDFDLGGPFSHEVSIGILEGGNGEDGTLFGSARRRPTFYSHLKNDIRIGEAADLELGLSHLAGSRDDDAAFETNVLGMDATWIQRFGGERHIKLQSEAFYVNRTESFFEGTDALGNLVYDDLDDNRHLWGSYMLADIRFHSQWAAGFRFDNVQLVDAAIGNPASADVGYTGYLTFHQSEFARWRLQFTHLDLSDGNTDDQVMLQGVFAIGEHEHDHDHDAHHVDKEG